MFIISDWTFTSISWGSDSGTRSTRIRGSGTSSTSVVTRWTGGFLGVISTRWTGTGWEIFSVSSTLVGTVRWGGTGGTLVWTWLTDSVVIWVVFINTWTLWWVGSVGITFITSMGVTNTRFTFGVTNNNNSRSDWDIFNFNGFGRWWEHWALWWWVSFWSTGQTVRFTGTSTTDFRTSLTNWVRLLVIISTIWAITTWGINSDIGTRSTGTGRGVTFSTFVVTFLTDKGTVFILVRWTVTSWGVVDSSFSTSDTSFIRGTSSTSIVTKWTIDLFSNFIISSIEITITIWGTDSVTSTS